MRLLIAISLLLVPLLCGSGCDDEDQSGEGPGKKGYFNEDAYQGFFAHYPFGGHPPPSWKLRLDALAPGGPEAHPEAYDLARQRASQVGLVVSGEGQAHVVKIEAELLKKLIERVDAERKKGT